MLRTNFSEHDRMEKIEIILKNDNLKHEEKVTEIEETVKTKYLETFPDRAENATVTTPSKKKTDISFVLQLLPTDSDLTFVILEKNDPRKKQNGDEERRDR
uniref:Uncharacterized protein n=1 Tax=Vannella robusta TaxID=1487602 RepID=A0A7S4HV75_9EUKA|mmetsp:Transcript_16146/g.20664  ORF Transcript_16146/g.20664 Transcript_16146/m.20664 type:complete len:101 (+) Transcript_16146:619-921(+)